MLSTRRVYGPEGRWNVAETAPASGDESHYGRNKAVTEAAVRQVCGDKVAIFRLSNIFGYEYGASLRRTFLGLLLKTLHDEDAVFFDMHADTRRDFLPVEICARALVARALDGTGGTFNLGAGFPVACGSLARWVMEGFGSGKLICDPPVVREEFYLNMDKWRARFGPVTSEDEMRDYCIGIGRTLRCEKS
jgi:nucleoside-diphosphate-sugar epimerase